MRTSSRRYRSCAKAGAGREPIEDRGVELGDSRLMDLVRTAEKKTDEPLIVVHQERTAAERATDKHDNVAVDIGSQAQPAGFDEALLGLTATDQKTFDVTYPRTTRSRTAPGRR